MGGGDWMAARREAELAAAAKAAAAKATPTPEATAPETTAPTTTAPVRVTSTNTSTSTSTGASTATSTPKNTQPKEEPPKLVDVVDYAQDAVAGMPALGGPAAMPSPSQRTVDPQELVEYRMSKMMKADSPYTQQAMTNAMQFANKNGLLNTSIAASAGLDAAIRSALPIAQQDATTLHGQALENQRAVNEFLMQDYLTKNQFKLTEFGAKTTTYNQGLQQAYGRNIQSIELAWQKHQNALQRNLETSLAELKIAAESAMQESGFGHSESMAGSACVQRATSNLNARVMEIEANAHELTSERYEQLLRQARQAYDAEISAC
jgi:hypothetical protein